jgi:hypothetical protein
MSIYNMMGDIAGYQTINMGTVVKLIRMISAGGKIGDSVDTATSQGTVPLSPELFRRADVNGDGVLNDADVNLMEKYIMYGGDESFFANANFNEPPFFEIGDKVQKYNQPEAAVWQITGINKTLLTTTGTGVYYLRLIQDGSDWSGNVGAMWGISMVHLYYTKAVAYKFAVGDFIQNIYGGPINLVLRVDPTIEVLIGSPGAYLAKVVGESNEAWPIGTELWLDFDQADKYYEKVDYELPTYIITAQAETGGTISPSGQVAVSIFDSETFTIKATLAGYILAEVIIDGESVGAVPSDSYTYTFDNVMADHTITARFAVGGGAVQMGKIAHSSESGFDTSDYGSAANNQVIPIDHYVALAPSWYNNSQAVFAGYIKVSVACPDGTKITPSASSGNGQTLPIMEGDEAEIGYVYFLPFKVTQAGTYTITAKLYASSSSTRILALLSWSIIVEDVPKGAVEPGVIVGNPDVAITDRMGISLNQPVQIAVKWINNSANIKFAGEVLLSVIHKQSGDYLNLEAVEGQNQELGPMESGYVTFKAFTPVTAGEYVLSAGLWYGNIGLSTISWTMVANVPAGKIGYGKINIDDAGWIAAGDQNIKQLSAVKLKPSWTNTSLGPFDGTLEVNVKYPDGTYQLLAPYTKQPITVAQGKLAEVLFENLNVNLIGAYQILIYLKCGTTLLDEQSYTLNVMDIPKGAVSPAYIIDNYGRVWPYQDINHRSADVSGSYLKDFKLQIAWINNSLNLKFAGRIDLEITYPSGVTDGLEAIYGNNLSAEPLERKYVTFNWLFRPGTHTFKATLRESNSDKVLSTYSWTTSFFVSDVDPKNRMILAKGFIDSLYESVGTRGFMKEYQGFPLRLYCRDTRTNLFLGTWYDYTTRQPVSDLSINKTLVSSDKASISIADVNFTIGRDYEGDMISYKIAFKGDYTGDLHYDVYLGNSLIWSNLGKETPSFEIPGVVYFQYGLPAMRYTLRHGSQLGRWTYLVWGETTKSTRLTNVRNTYFGSGSPDIYDPLFGQNSSMSDNFIYTSVAYKDTLTAIKKMEVGVNPNRYPYVSKIQSTNSLGIYLAQAPMDPLGQCLQAIHILNKYKSASRKYKNNTPFSPTFATLTPLGVAQDVYKKYNGFGIPISTILSSSDYSSGVRTASFLILVTLLGYKYKIAEMKTIADEVFSRLNEADTSPQAIENFIVTAENGHLLRPQYSGCFYGVWRNNHSYFNGLRTDISAVTDQTGISEMVDFLNMPSEEIGPIPANQESCMTMLQAFRVYCHYALGFDYPSNKYLPGESNTAAAVPAQIATPSKVSDAGLPYPPESLIAYKTKGLLISSFFSKYKIPSRYQSYWKTLKFILHTEYPIEIGDGGELASAAAVLNEFSIHANLNYISIGILAHEIAHLCSTSISMDSFYNALQSLIATGSSSVLNLLMGSEAWAHWAGNDSKFNNLSMQILEQHADVYRFLGKYMPTELKIYYPKLF